MTQPKSSEELRRELIDLLTDFENRLDAGDLRQQVRSLIPILHFTRDLGTSLLPEETATSARARILHYFQCYPGVVISSDELAVVSGISEYARRVRELRIEFGWPIYTGHTAMELLADEESEETHLFSDATIRTMRSTDYILLGSQDRDAAHRWNVASAIRKSDLSTREKILEFLRCNVGVPVTGEELRYIARDTQSWPRRTRELRTEEGWPVVTRNSGRPDLPVGSYLLEADRQSPAHDRQIPDPIRILVLERDNFSCQYCGWDPGDRKEGDPRALIELHHIRHLADRGGNDLNNLIVLCNVHHDEVHRKKIADEGSFRSWLKGSTSH